jgi:hypothetical protein
VFFNNFTVEIARLSPSPNRGKPVQVGSAVGIRTYKDFKARLQHLQIVHMQHTQGSFVADPLAIDEPTPFSISSYFYSDQVNRKTLF